MPIAESQFICSYPERKAVLLLTDAKDRITRYAHLCTPIHLRFTNFSDWPSVRFGDQVAFFHVQQVANAYMEVLAELDDDVGAEFNYLIPRPFRHHLPSQPHLFGNDRCIDRAIFLRLFIAHQCQHSIFHLHTPALISLHHNRAE